MAIAKEVPVIAQEIRHVVNRIQKSADAMFQLGDLKAETEKSYRLALSQELLKLRADGMQMALIADVAKGNVADLMFARDAAEAKFKAAQEAVESLRSALSALQSILRHLDE